MERLPELTEEDKPTTILIGEDGNVFNIMGLVSRALRDADLKEYASEFTARATSSGSYSEVLALTMEYVNVE